MFHTADVHLNQSVNYFSVNKVAKFLRSLENDLGHDIFLKSIVIKRAAHLKKPIWLYRIYTEEELV